MNPRSKEESHSMESNKTPDQCLTLHSKRHLNHTQCKFPFRYVHFPLTAHIQRKLLHAGQHGTGWPQSCQ